MLSAEQIEMRQTGIGASEAAAAIGLNPFTSALDIYLRKLELVEEPDFETNENVYWGNEHENSIGRRYMRDRAGCLLDPARTFRHPKYDFVLATPDRLYLDHEPRSETPMDMRIAASKRLVEFKTAGVHMAKLFGEEGTDEIPYMYLVQAQLQMAVTDKGECDVAILIGGNRYKEYPVERNEKAISGIIERLEKFWTENIQAKNPPAAGASESAKKALALLYPRHIEDFLESNAEIEQLVAKLKAAKLTSASADIAVLALENRIKEVLKDKQGVITEAGKVTWRTGKGRLVTDWKGIVAEIEPDAAIVKKFTTSKPGSRRFNTPRNWKEE